MSQLPPSPIPADAGNPATYKVNGADYLKLRGVAEDLEQRIAAVMFYINAIEKIAFQIPPVNIYTPRIVQLCVETRNCAQESKP